MRLPNEALQEANWNGYQSARRDEVIRMLDIMEHEIARERSEAAWMALPLGWSADDTLMALKELPREPLDEAAHEDRIAGLRARLEEIEAEHRAFLAARTNKETAHVH